MPWKGNALMPTCTEKQQQEILSVIDTLKGKEREEADELLKDIGPKELCRTLHAIRRWYSFQTWNAAKKILKNREALAKVMNLEPPKGIYRGFKVDRKDPLAALEEGAKLSIPVTRNGGASSWTTRQDLANRFSGATKDKVGIIIQLEETKDVQAFIAPPHETKPWFNKLYAETMGNSFRVKEDEYAIYAPSVNVNVVKMKRR